MPRKNRYRAIVVGLAAVVIVLQVRQLQLDWSEEVRGPQLAKGEPVPHFVIQDTDGSIIDLRQHLGQFVVVTFWASWCMPCLAEMPEIASLVDEWEKLETRRHELAIIAINLKESPENVELQLNDPRYGRFSFGFDEDGTLARSWKVHTLPSTFLVSPTGRLLEASVGYEPLFRYRLLGLMGSHDDERRQP